MQVTLAPDRRRQYPAYTPLLRILKDVYPKEKLIAAHVDGIMTDLSVVLLPSSVRYSNPPLPGTPTPLSRVLQPRGTPCVTNPLTLDTGDNKHGDMQTAEIARA